MRGRARAGGFTLVEVLVALLVMKDQTKRAARYVETLTTEYPDYGWDRNKGYGSATHRESLSTLGVTEYHRRSWNLVPQQLQPRLL